MFCGGPVAALDFLPAISGVNEQLLNTRAYLAVSVFEDANLGKQQQQSGIVQLWAINNR